MRFAFVTAQLLGCESVFAPNNEELFVAVREVLGKDQKEEHRAAARKKYGPLSTWDVSRVTDMFSDSHGSLFIALGGNPIHEDLSKWDVSKVKDMYGMFEGADGDINVGDISKWDVSKVTDMSWMFGCFYNDATRCHPTFNADLSKWNTSRVTKMRGMFGQAAKFNSPLGKWDVSKVRDFNHMFDGAKSFSQDLRRWKVKEGDKVNGEPIAECHHVFDGVPCSMCKYVPNAPTKSFTTRCKERCHQGVSGVDNATALV